MRLTVALVALSLFLLTPLADAQTPDSAEAPADAAAQHATDTVAPAARTTARPPAVVAVPAARQADNVAIITIRGPIDAVTAASVKRRLKRAEIGGADAVVFDINTPGGEVVAILEITAAIKNSPIANTVAWIHPTAYSGGAIIALSCREIVVASAAQFGDAAPITAMGSLRKLTEGDPELRAKLFAPLMGDVVDSARRNGYDEKLVQGFLMTGVDLWLVERKETGLRYFIDRTEFHALFGVEPPATPASFTNASGAARPPAAAHTTASPSSSDPDAFAPAAPGLDNETIKAINLRLETPSGRPVFSQENKNDYVVIEHVSDGSTLLVLSTKDMLRLGLASATIRNDKELQAHFGARNIRRMNRTWSETLVRALSSLPVRGLLVVVFLLALYLEMAAPGIGLAGGVALMALMGLAGPPLLLGAASWWSVAAVASGIALVFMEILVIPGFGVAGVGGAVLILGGLIGLIAGEDALFPDSPTETKDLLYGVSTLLLALVTTSVGIYFISKRIGSLPMLNRLVLSTSVPRGDDGPTGMLMAMEQSDDSAIREGDVGKVISALRPSGRAEIHSRLVDVVSEMGFIDEGVRVRVIEASRFRVVVEPVSKPAPDGADAMGEHDANNDA